MIENVKSKVKILVGSHGSGKSEWLYNYFIEKSRKDDNPSKIDFNKKLYLIVPEQDTNDKQRLMMKKSKEYGFGAGIMNIDVVSFDRIAHNVFDILSIEPSKENVIDDDAKAMILSLVMSELNRDNELKYYRRMINKMGFAKKLTEAVSELYSYNVSDEEVLKASKSKQATFIMKEKLEDLSKIYKGFKTKLKELNYFIKEDKYDLLNKSILDTDIFDGAIVAFDGFTGFTPVQLDIFKKIASVAKEVYILIDHREPKEILDYDFSKINRDDSAVYDIFYISKKFISDIMMVLNISNVKELLDEYSIKNDVVKYNKDNIYSTLKYDKKDLSFLESNLYKNIDFSSLYDEEVTNIESYVANTIDEEVKNATQIILDLVRNKGYKYNDIKIVVSNVQNYRDAIIRNFNKCNIPLFIDDSESILNSPYVETVRAAIDVINYNFSYDSIVRYINSGLFKKNRDFDLFDNFIRKHAVRGYNRYRDGIDKISMSDEEKECIFGFKKEYIDPLILLYEKIRTKGNCTISSYINALLEFIKAIEFDEKFKNLISDMELQLEEDISLHRELAILNYSKEILIKTFKQLIDIEKNNLEEISLEDFKLLFEVGITSKGVKSIPYIIDQVVVGDLMRSRFDNPRIEIVLGLNQSYIPSHTSDMTIIDDEMRIIFANEVKELSQTTIETALNQRYYIYLALTNPIDKLILSYARADVNGDADEKSPVLTMIENMFFDKESKIKNKVVDSAKFKFYNKHDLISFVALNMQNIKKSVKKDDKGSKKYNFDANSQYDIYKANEIIKYLENDDKKYFDSIYSSVLDQKNYVVVNNIPKEINEDLIHLEGGKLHSSASSVEAFNNCPYKFFLNNTLKIGEREKYSIKPVDLGNLAHSVFEKVFNDSNIIDKDENAVSDIVDNEVEAGFKFYDSFKEFDKKDNDYFGANRLEYIKGRTKEMIQKSVSTLIDIARSSKLKVLKTEGKFYYGIGDETIVNGRIDRVETYESGDNIYINVIDYKSGKEKEFNKTNLENGTDIQLTLYIDYCLNEKFKKENRKPVFCGSFYFNLSDKINTKDIVESVEKFNKTERENTGYKGLANKSKIVMQEVFPDALFDTLKNGDDIKKAKLKNDYSLSGKFVSEDELNEYIAGLHTTIDNTTKRIKTGDIEPSPVNANACRYCPYISVCKKDQMISTDDSESDD